MTCLSVPVRHSTHQAARGRLRLDRSRPSLCQEPRRREPLFPHLRFPRAFVSFYHVARPRSRLTSGQICSTSSIAFRAIPCSSISNMTSARVTTPSRYSDHRPRSCDKCIAASTCGRRTCIGVFDSYHENRSLPSPNYPPSSCSLSAVIRGPGGVQTCFPFPLAWKDKPYRVCHLLPDHRCHEYGCSVQARAAHLSSALCRRTSRIRVDHCR